MKKYNAFNIINSELLRQKILFLKLTKEYDDLVFKTNNEPLNLCSFIRYKALQKKIEQCEADIKAILPLHIMCEKAMNISKAKYNSVLNEFHKYIEKQIMFYDFVDFSCIELNSMICDREPRKTKHPLVPFNNLKFF